MAFGDLRGTLSGGTGSIPTNPQATGSVAVSVGDLVFAVFAQQTNLTIGTVTDNLGHTYTPTNAGTDGGTATGRAYYLRVTTAGTLTTITGTATSSNNDWNFGAAVFEGPFASSPLDANPANSTDNVSPYDCPSTGTLAQADEMVVGWLANSGDIGTVAATSPNILRYTGIALVLNAEADIGSQVVSSTSAVAPSFTSASGPSACVVGTSSFKKALPTDLPPGKFFSDLPTPPYPPPGPTWIGQYNKNLIAQDRMVVGKQITDLSPIGPAYPQQLRTWALSLLQSTLAPIPQIPPGEQFYVLPPVGPQQPIPIWTRSYNPNLIAQDAMVTGEQITDLPPRAYPEPATRTWTWSYNLNLIGRDRLTVGEQLYDLPPKGPEQPLRRWEWSYNLNLIGKDQLPVGEQSIALPPIGYEYPQGLRTWIQSLQQSTLAPVVAAPFSQSDWPVSYGPTQPLRSWTWSYNLNLIGKDALPIGEQRTELPPTGYIYPNDIRTWINRVNLALTTQAAKLPFNQYDWPNPRAHQQPDRSWFRSYNLNLIGKDRLPAGKRVTDLPPRAYPEPATRTWTYSFNLNLRGKDQILVGKQLTDLPPRDYLRPTQVRTWTHSYNLNLIGKDRLPVGKQITDLPPQGPLVANDLRTWINKTNLALIIIPTTLPFNQYDWPIYRDLSYPTDNRSWINACNLNLGIPVYISPIPPVPPPTPPTDSRIAYNAGNEWQIFDRIREPGPIGWR